MPFSKVNLGTSELNTLDLNYIYQEIIRKAVDEFELDGKKYFNEVRRYDEKVGSIIKGIVQKIKDADLVIADLTGLNPNVMYELGVRHSLKRGTIMLTQDFDSFPSDLRDYMTVLYNYSTSIHDQSKNYESFKQDLHRNISEIIQSKKIDSPVLEYVVKKEFYQNEQEVKDLKESAIILNSLFEDFDDIAQLMFDSQNSSNINEPVLLGLLNFHLNCFNSKLLLLRIPFTSEMLYEDVINVSSVMTEIMKKTTMNDFLSSIFGSEIQLPKLGNIIDEKILDPINLKENQEIKYCSIKEIFSEDCFLFELLNDIEDFINDEAKRLGVEEEINELFIED